MQLTGHGGMEKLMFRSYIPVPAPWPWDVLIKVSAAGVNNTDVNTWVVFEIKWRAEVGFA